jgi:predicted dinucleotide-binding enzyme
MAEGGGMEAALKFAQVAFIALPYDCILPALKPLQNLENKILVDLSNPPDTRQTPVESWVERLQAALPRASVIKAFNTLSAQQLVAPSSRTRRPQTLIAGDDEVAKGKIAAIARTLKLDAIDAGPLNHGTWLEQLGLLNRYLNRNRHKAMPSSPTWLGL